MIAGIEALDITEIGISLNIPTQWMIRGGVAQRESKNNLLAIPIQVVFDAAGRNP
jgi:hypothetical protein